MKNPVGRPPNHYFTWLCYYLARVSPAVARRLPQHKDSGGSYAKVAGKLSMEPGAVEQHIRKAEAWRDEDNAAAYLEWVNEREKMWWFYQAECIEKRVLKPRESFEKPVTDDNTIRFFKSGDFFQTRKEINAFLTKAKGERTWITERRREERSPKEIAAIKKKAKERRQLDYKIWLSIYKRRTPSEKSRYWLFQQAKTHGPRTIRSVSTETKAKSSATRKALYATREREIRDSRIRESHRAGTRLKQLAELHHLTTARISQILKRDCPKASNVAAMSSWVSLNHPDHTGLPGCSCKLCNEVWHPEQNN